VTSRLRTTKTGFSVGGPPGLDVTVVQIVVPSRSDSVRRWLYEEVEELLAEYSKLFPKL
jgi:hypothetical protein